jgi:hypothetical protein
MLKIEKGIFDNTTEWDEIFEFASERVKDPIKINREDGTTAVVFNFNPHNVDHRELQKFVKSAPKFYKRFIIPHSMSAAWGEILLYLSEIHPDILNRHLYINYRRDKYLGVFPPDWSYKIFNMDTKEFDAEDDANSEKD